jgi:NDP-sugar pyrophosphorylase family protein
VLNGDSIVEVDFLRLIRFHQRSGGMATLVAIRSPNDKRFGTILSEANGRVIRFEEKAERGSGGLVNAGVYVFSRKILDLIPDGPTSLEKDVLPRILPLGVFALEQEGEFIDIGTPRDYARAQSMYERLKKAALRKSQTPSDEHSGDECN